MTKVAKFSNGYELSYTGKRAVSAAWLVTDKEGNIVSEGFSKNKETAMKTIKANPVLTQQKHSAKTYLITRKSLSHHKAHVAGLAKQHGFVSVADWAEHAKAQNEAYFNSLTIEIVEV